MNTKRTRILAIVATLCLAGFADPQSSPSKAETVEWLKSKLPLLSGTWSHGDVKETFRYDSFDFADCSFAFQVVTSSSLPPGIKSDGPSVVVESYLIDLRKVSSIDALPQGSSDHLPYITFVSKTDSIGVVRSSRSKWIASGEFHEHLANLFFANSNEDNVDLAPRVAKAANNLISICKAQPPADKEVF